MRLLYLGTSGYRPLTTHVERLTCGECVCVIDALAATTNHEVILGDKGDGSPRARAVALQRYAWANEGHVPDIIHKNAADNGMHELFESKVYTAAKTSNNKGGGTARGGGSPSTAADHCVSFVAARRRSSSWRTLAAARAGPQARAPSPTPPALAGCALARGGATAM